MSWKIIVELKITTYFPQMLRLRKWKIKKGKMLRRGAGSQVTLLGTKFLPSFSISFQTQSLPRPRLSTIRCHIGVDYCAVYLNKWYLTSGIKDTITPSIRILDTFLWRSRSLNFWCWFPVENNFPATLFFWEVLWLIDQIRQARAGEGAKVCKQPPTFTNTTFYISYFQIFILLCKTIF